MLALLLYNTMQKKKIKKAIFDLSLAFFIYL